MADQQHVDILLHDGVEDWNRWCREESIFRPELGQANLRGANLRGAYLGVADLSGADLSEADLYKANLCSADVRGANLRGANLRGANLSEASLAEADLTDADLTDADLSDADLNKANFSGADLIRADLIRANLRGANFFEADLTNAHLFEANLTGADLRRADLSEADLSGAICVRTEFCGAKLIGCRIYGMSAWDLDLDGANQTDLSITPLGVDANITVDNLEVAQFLYLLLSNRKVRNVLDTITSKVVLILGRFSEERKPVLDALRGALRRHPYGYIPVLFDFEPQLEKPAFETVKTLANLARFVIADLTDPNMVRSELTYITANVRTVPVQPVIRRGAILPTEYESWKVNNNAFLPLFRYDSLQHLLANLAVAVITPLEQHVVARGLADGDGV